MRSEASSSGGSPYDTIFRRRCGSFLPITPPNRPHNQHQMAPPRAALKALIAIAPAGLSGWSKTVASPKAIAPTNAAHVSGLVFVGGFSKPARAPTQMPIRIPMNGMKPPVARRKLIMLKQSSTMSGRKQTYKTEAGQASAFEARRCHPHWYGSSRFPTARQSYQMIVRVQSVNRPIPSPIPSGASPRAKPTGQTRSAYPQPSTSVQRPLDLAVGRFRRANLCRW